MSSRAKKVKDLFAAVRGPLQPERGLLEADRVYLLIVGVPIWAKSSFRSYKMSSRGCQRSLMGSRGNKRVL